MPETPVFRCSCCGQIAPRDRLDPMTGAFPLESFLQTYGGKTKLSDEDRELRRGLPFQRGSGPGKINYEKLDVDQELRELFANRIAELTDGKSL